MNRRDSAADSERDAAPTPPSPPPAPAPAPAPAPLVLQQYDMSGDKLLLIFNHYEFQDTTSFKGQPHTRKGTAYDVARLSRVFQSFGFRVQVYHDLVHEKIGDILTKLSAQDHAGTSCVCVAVLTHGEEQGVVYAADRPYELRELVSRLQHGDAGLVGKPKLFLVQACRGEQVDSGRVELDGAGAATLGSHADTLLLTSTVEDFVSWRAANGSWLIQELCRVLESTHQDLDFLQMTTLVTSLVTRERVSHSERLELDRKKQTPETRSTLTKLLRFSLAAPPTPPTPTPL